MRDYDRTPVVQVVLLPSVEDLVHGLAKKVVYGSPQIKAAGGGGVVWYTAVRQRHQWVCDTVRRARAGRRATWCAGRGGVQRQWRNVACTCRAAVVYPRFTRSQERRGWGSSWVCRTARHSLWCAVCEEWEGVRTIGTGRERAAHAVGAVSAAPLLRCSACDCQEWPWPRSAHLSERRGTVIPPPSNHRRARHTRCEGATWIGKIIFMQRRIGHNRPPPDASDVRNRVRNRPPC